MCVTTTVREVQTGRKRSIGKPGGGTGEKMGEIVASASTRAGIRLSRRRWSLK